MCKRVRSANIPNQRDEQGQFLQPALLHGDQIVVKDDYERYKQSALDCECRNWARLMEDKPELLHSKKCHKYNLTYEMRYATELYDEEW